MCVVADEGRALQDDLPAALPGPLTNTITVIIIHTNHTIHIIIIANIINIIDMF